MSAAASTSSTDVSLIRATQASSGGVRRARSGRSSRRRSRSDRRRASSPRATRWSKIAPDRLVRARVLVARMRAEVDALEHERPQRQHRRADLVALDDVAGPLRLSTRSWTSVSIRARAGRRAARSPRAAARPSLEDPEADRVVDVVVDVRDAVDDADDLALERRRLAPAGVREDAVAHLPGQVQRARRCERLLVVAEPRARSAPAAPRRARSSPACPNGGWPMSCPRPIASTRSSFSRSARATPREIAVVSSVCVMRVR